MQVPGPAEPLVLMDRGRKHHQPPLSATAEFRPHLKMNEQARSRRGLDPSPTGRRHFAPRASGEEGAGGERPGSRQIPELSRRSGYDVVDPDLSLQVSHVSRVCSPQFEAAIAV